MSEEKLSSDKVPQKLVEWLLSMGCPQDKVPSADKLAGICRGDYYMVWRSLVEHVEPKESIKRKRLQVFRNDFHRYQKKNAFSKVDRSVVIPEGLSSWKRQTQLQERVADADAQVLQARQEINNIMDKVSSRLSHRNLSRGRVQAAQRRVWLLQQLAEESRAKKYNLLEARSIVDLLSITEDCSDVDAKLDRVTSRRQNRNPPGSLSVSVAPLASSSVASNNGDLNDSEEQLQQIVKCAGSLWPQLCERRAALTTALSTPTVHETYDTNRTASQRVRTHTAALHCSLALEIIKNKAHTKLTQKRLAVSLTQLNDYLSDEACELLVVRCERDQVEARVFALRALFDEVTSRSGVFAAAWDTVGDRHAGNKIAVADKAIENQSDELKRVIMCLALTERKIQNVRECLITVFNGFHTDENDRFDGRLSLPQESVSTLLRFYVERRERHRNKMTLSMDLEISDSSYDAAENSNPTFIDELKIYLKKFELEKNRKLVLDSGEKIWVFETLQSSVSRLLSSWQQDNVKCSLVCPSVSLSRNLQRLILMVQQKHDMEFMLKVLEGVQRKVVVIDISSEKEEEDRTLDKIKKRLNENLLSLQKTTKTLDLGLKNLQLWSNYNVKIYISPNRTFNGASYKQYEECYLQCWQLYFKVK